MKNKISLLDCTLRDGGYNNHWVFGSKNIDKIVSCLNRSNIDIVELGFVDPCYKNDINKSIKGNITYFDSLVKDKNYNNSLHTVMVNYGKVNVNDFPCANQCQIKGIRIAFKKNDYKKSLLLANSLKKKGYYVFIQAMVATSYSDVEFINLINETNKIKPYAFYIVDSFGDMDENTLTHLFYLTEKKLLKQIKIGFHSHNNMQLSFSNAKNFLNFKSKHELIIDSSIFGMGRGAGNLNTELFMEYLNANKKTHYNLMPILEVIDDIIYSIYERNKWGYNIPYYLTAKYHCHPNYATYLYNKKSLSYSDMEIIIKNIKDKNKYIYDQDFIDKIYYNYEKEKNSNNIYKCDLNFLKNSTVLLVGPGRSLINSNVQKPKEVNVTISVNHKSPYFKIDYFFIGNNRRYNVLKNCINLDKCITTSNINSKSKYIVPYFLLINKTKYVFDNSLLMILKLLIKNKVKKVYLAGFDGFTNQRDLNYYSLELSNDSVHNTCYLNNFIASQIKVFANKIKIIFLTPSIYNKLFTK